jgi:uncharacterized protein involved in type VI secretion and phage assembly
MSAIGEAAAFDTGHAPPTARWYGVHPALVSDVKDPDGQGRVKIALPWAPDGDGGTYEAWARLATLMAGSGRGSWFVPDVDDEVLVGFEGGDPRRPYVLGCLWNGVDAPPQAMDGAGANDKKVLMSRNGVTIALDDADGRERLVLETPGGQRLTLSDGPGSIAIEDAAGNSATFDAGGITITAVSKLKITAATVEITAATFTVNAGMSKFSGVVKADTVITNSVVASSYTPGAGNLQ